MAAKRENALPIMWLLAGGAALLLIYLLRDILAPFLIAATLAYICNPLVDRLVRLKCGRTWATTLVLALLLGVGLLMLLIVIPLMQKELVLLAQRIPAYLNTARAQLEPWLLQHFGISMEFDLAALQGMLSEHWQTAGNFLARALRFVGDHGAALFGWFATLLLVPVVLFYLLRDWNELVERIAHLIPRAWHGKVAEIAREIDAVLAEFLRGQLSVIVLMSIFYACGLWIAGLELALPIGLLAGLLVFVPYLGATLGIILALLAAALQFGTLMALLPVVVVFALGQMLESMLLTPWLVGDRIGLHPVAVIFALMAGGQLFGFAGILLALPVGAAIAVGFRHAKHSYLASDTYQK